MTRTWPAFETSKIISTCNPLKKRFCHHFHGEENYPRFDDFTKQQFPQGLNYCLTSDFQKIVNLGDYSLKRIFPIDSFKFYMWKND